MTTEPTIQVSGAASSRRLTSLDALRGFDMLWIAGADAFGGAFEHLRGGPASRLFAYELGHSTWAGFRFYDLIFPLFVFMVGVAIPYSLERLVAERGRAAALRRVARRTLLLYVLGLFYYGGLSGSFEHVRLLGVLQRIALCYGLGSLLFMALKPRGLAAACAVILLGYWALLALVPVPGFGAGDFAPDHNLANWIDRTFLPGRLWYGTYDPEGLLSTLPAVATCLLGVFAGLLLRDPGRSGAAKAKLLLAGGAAMAAAGYLWGLELPVIKKIWTSSFVLVAGGWSAVLLGSFYTVIDLWNCRRWAEPFVWIGTNALTVYLISNIVDFPQLSQRLAGGPVSAALDALWPGLGGLVLALVSVGLCLAVARFLHRRRIFIRL